MPVIVCKTVFLHIDDDNTVDPSQKPALLRYYCFVRQAMSFSHHTSCSHAVKKIFSTWSTEKTDNKPTDKTEQVNSAMKQSLSFLIVNIFKQMLTIIFWLLIVSWKIAVAPQFKRRMNQMSFSYLLKGHLLCKMDFYKSFELSLNLYTTTP